MDPVALFLSRTGRIGRRPFWPAVVLVYAAAVISQSLLSWPVIARAGLWPFVFAQAILIWSWYALHAKRLRDGGGGTGAITGVAILYALAVVLLLLIMMSVVTYGPNPPDGASAQSAKDQLLGFVVLLYVIGLLTSTIEFGAIWWLVAALLLITFLPLLVGFGFTLYAGTRPTKA